MSDLISRKYLYDKMLEKEELARQRVLDTPTHSPAAYLRYVAQMNERTALKHEIMDAPAAEPQWIPCSEQLPLCQDPESLAWTPVLVTYLAYYSKAPMNDMLAVFDYEDNCWRWYEQEEDIYNMEKCIVEVVAWMPLPQPYKGEQHG